MRIGSISDAEKFSQSLRGPGIPRFQYEPGNVYRMAIVRDANGEFVALSFAVHNCKITKRNELCVLGHVDPTPDPLDPSKQKNDGSCPYCSVAGKLNTVVNEVMDAWRAENPDASEDAQKEQFKKVSEKHQLVGRRMEDYFFIFPQFITLDKAGLKLDFDADGDPKFKLVYHHISKTQFDKKLKNLLSETSGESVAHEIWFDYPATEGKTDQIRKMLSAKDLSIRPPITGTLKLFQDYPNLTGKIMEAIDKLFEVKKEGDTPIFDRLDTSLGRKKSILTITKEIEQVSSLITEGSTPEELEKLAENLENDSAVSSEQAIESATASAEDVLDQFGMG